MHLITSQRNKAERTAIPNRTPCFLEAFNKKESGTITMDEYFEHLFAHCDWQFDEHPDDNMMPQDDPIVELEEIDPLDLGYGYCLNRRGRQTDKVTLNTISR
jgi:hypothetical protein